MLLHVGGAYREALASYYVSTPGTTKRWPKSLDELLNDRRQVGVKRHIRRLYVDPITGALDWTLLRAQDGGIWGVQSTSQERPIRSGGYELERLRLDAAAAYAGWMFDARTLVESGGRQ
ncbi:hypothetical protein [Hydrogenophaga sp. 5NK40-0174]|uniref:hypothetical protein n=1 Tax=Hydrogenophaga sp. 5NK40-0174 TaxID=3127649 RepID=UPI0033402F87